MTDFDVSSQLFSQAAVLLMVGMGFVFAFLTLLIIVIKFIISPLALHFPDPIPKVKNDTSIPNNESSAVVAAISVAINQYRQKHKTKA